MPHHHTLATSAFAMYYLYLIALLLAHLPITTVARHAGVPGGVFTCEGPSWNGNYKWTDSETMSKCVSFTTTIRSIGPDWGGYCILYGSGGCRPEHEIRKLYAPGMWNGVPGFSAMRCLEYH